MSQSTASFPFFGGLDLVTSPVRTPPGRVIAALNYEPRMGGYRRLRGFERFDGRPAPSEATYWRVDYTLGGFGTGAEPSVGDTLYNGAPDHFVLVKVITFSGAWASGTATGYFVATSYTGTITPTQLLFTAPSAGQNAATAGTITLEYDFSLGNELVTNGDYSSATGHTLSGGATISDDKLRFDGTGTGRDLVTALETLTAAEYTYSFDLDETNEVDVVFLNIGGTVLAVPDSDIEGHFEGTLASAASTQTISIFADVGVVAVIDNFSVKRGNASHPAAARAVTRSLILAVPGSGPVRGVWCFEDQILAIRDNAGATAGVMFKATTSGWTVVVLLTKIPFTCDTATQTLPTNLLAKLASGVANASSSTSDGTVRRVVISSTVGTVNTGYFLVSGYVAAQFTAGGQTIYLAGTATVLGTTTAAASATAALPAGGRYFFLNHNFYGATDLSAAYMANGVGPALAYDGVGLTAISTGMTVDTPNRIAAHRKSLFLSFPGGSVQFSQVGEPLIFDAILGAGEIGIGSDVTDLIPANKTTLAILGEESINVLYGNDATDYQLEVLTDEAGALPYTAQKVGQVLYMDNGGVRKLTSSAAYGNFNIGSVSQLIAPLLADYVRDGVRPVATFTSRRHNQYWLFLDNGAGLIGHFGRKEPEFMPFVIGKTVSCGCSVEVGSTERMFIGCSDGFVHEMDKGTSFDGSAIEHYIRLPFNSFGSPQVDKRVFKGTLSLEASGTTTLSVAVDMDFGGVTGYPAQELVVTTGGGAIDDLGSNEQYYASQIETVGEVYFDGVARNFSMTIRGETDDEEPHTLVDATYHVAQRRLVR